MLMLFPTIKVPGLDKIEIFGDHDKSDTFYALKNNPKIAIDENGTPQLSFNFFSRNADIAYASSANKELIESQLGQLLFTTDLSLTEEEHNKITEYLEKIANNKQHKFNRLYNKLTKGKNKPVRRNSKNKPIIKLGTPNTWKEGTARLELLEGLGDTFKKQSSAEVKPSLVGSNSASFYTTFGIEGSQIYYDALTKGYTGDENNITPLQAIVRYDLRGFAFVPNLEVKVTGKSKQIYDYLKEYQEDYTKNRGGSYIVKVSGSRRRRKKTVRDSRSVTASKEDISKLVEEMIDKKVIRIEIVDYGDISPNSQEVKEIQDNILSTLMDTIMNTIIPSFFETAFIGEESLDDGSEEGQNDDTKPKSDTGISDDEKSRPNVSSHYYFKDEVDKKKINSLNFNFKKSGTVEFRRYPSGVLITDLTQDQREKLIKHIDISSPEVQILTVQASVNADFVNDKIHSIILNMYYSEKDHKSGIVRENTKSFLYKTGDEVNTFRVTMARNSKGELIDLYRVVAKISYIGTSDSPPPIELNGVSDRSLVISYDKLGFITVNCIVGDIDWTIVKEAMVNLEYTAAPNQPDTKKEIRLNQEVPSGSWRCYMYGKTDKSYKYKVKYINHDGQESESEVKKDTRDTLLIDDLLTGRAKASFDVILDTNTVKTAKVEILYEDTTLGLKEEFSKWFSQTETWDWVMRLREDGTDSFKYRYFVQYSDDVVFTSEWKTARTDEDIPPFHFKRHVKPLTIDGGLLDWNIWQVVYVSVSYDDEANNYFVQKNIRIDATNFLETFEVMAFSAKPATFKYSIKYAKAGSQPITIDEQLNSTGLLILESPVSNEPTVK